MTARWYRTYGNGPLCPEADDHGAMYEIADALGRALYWCPVTQHLFAIGPGLSVGERAAREEVNDGHGSRGNAPAVARQAGG